MLSNACKYAIRSVLYLSVNFTDNTKVGVKKIAEELKVPQPFLSKLLQQLTKNDLVSSSKGPAGGFYLNEKNLKNTVWDIIKCIDGTTKFDNCFMGLSSCNDLNPCPVHFTVAPFKQKLMIDFKDKSIQQFSEDIKIKGQHIFLK
ncbi:RrF2 family transcriptional regulator [Tenacibaculum insulae]|uniref:RrF2 family transcriptional regulator n=1 Tax=Tenacibaculum insulae TaxID=2029677 RepID=UPI003AB38820